MKIKSLIYSTLAATLLFASCDLNKQPVFDDANAFVAFDKVSARVDEAKDGVPCSLELTLYCASVKGVSAQVDVVADNEAYEGLAKGVEGENYRIAKIETYTIDDNTKERINVVEVTDSKTIKFDADHRFASIYVETINDDNRTEISDKNFDLKLTNEVGCKLGESKLCAVRISDDEDPINQLVGNYKGSAQSLFDGSQESWDLTIARSNGDTLLINPVIDMRRANVPTCNDIYAIASVDPSNTSGIIALPLGQPIYGGEGQSYNLALVTMDNNANPVKSGSNVANFQIADDGSITITWTQPFGVGNLVDDSWWWQAVQSVVYVK